MERGGGQRTKAGQGTKAGEGKDKDGDGEDEGGMGEDKDGWAGQRQVWGRGREGWKEGTYLQQSEIARLLPDVRAAEGRDEVVDAHAHAHAHRLFCVCVRALLCSVERKVSCGAMNAAAAAATADGKGTADGKEERQAGRWGGAERSKAAGCACILGK